MLIYLDNSSTTKQYEAVTKRMITVMEDDFGNPSSLHRMGIAAENVIKEAREKVAMSLAVKPEEIYFTGSGTEANNLAVFGAYERRKRKGSRIITSKAEHPAVIEVCKKLENQGVEVVYIGIDKHGLINIEELKDNINDDTMLVSLMSVNNELGTVSPLEEIGGLLSERNILFHTDAVQAYGKIPIEINRWKVDLMTVSAHKIHGPKGMGAIFIKKGTGIQPLIYGGGQEKGVRSGTENTPGIAGFGTAADIMMNSFSERTGIMERARTYLLNGIKEEIKDIRINSPEEIKGNSPLSSPGILNVSFLGCPGEVLLRHLEQRDIFVSTAAACSSKKGKSRVLAAAGLAGPIIDSAIRFSFSEFNDVEQMDFVLTELKRIVSSVRRVTHKR